MKLNDSEMPGAEFFRVLLDGMKCARADGDLIRENLLYFRMIDIFRAPDLVKTMTKKELDFRRVKLKDRFQKKEMEV